MNKNNIFHPGAAEYGNFINYYEFNSSTARLHLLPDDFWSAARTWKICLDVGCNTGELTRSLHKHILEVSNNPVKFLAVDLDSHLIDRASGMRTEGITFAVSDVTSGEFRQLSTNYLTEHNADVFDVIFAFSVTMWIHVHKGDDELNAVLSQLSQQTRYLVIEPQPWKCYTSAARRMRRLGQENALPKLKELTIRNNIQDHIHNWLSEKNSMDRIFHSNASHWGRAVSLYCRDGERVCCVEKS